MVLLLLFFAILINNSINIIYLPFFTLTFVKILLLLNISTLNYILKFNKSSILNNNKLKIQAIYYVILFVLSIYGTNNYLNNQENVVNDSLILMIYIFYLFLVLFTIIYFVINIKFKDLTLFKKGIIEVIILYFIIFYPFYYEDIFYFKDDILRMSILVISIGIAYIDISQKIKMYKFIIVIIIGISYVMFMLPLNISQVYCANDVDYSKTSKTFMESNEKNKITFIDLNECLLLDKNIDNSDGKKSGKIRWEFKQEFKLNYIKSGN